MGVVPVGVVGLAGGVSTTKASVMAVLRQPVLVIFAKTETLSPFTSALDVNTLPAPDCDAAALPTMKNA
jgi:hypothetical protein